MAAISMCTMPSTPVGVEHLRLLAWPGAATFEEEPTADSFFLPPSPAADPPAPPEGAAELTAAPPPLPLPPLTTLPLLLSLGLGSSTMPAYRAIRLAAWLAAAATVGYSSARWRSKRRTQSRMLRSSFPAAAAASAGFPAESAESSTEQKVSSTCS